MPVSPARSPVIGGNAKWELRRFALGPLKRGPERGLDRTRQLGEREGGRANQGLLVTKPRNSPAFVTTNGHRATALSQRSHAEDAPVHLLSRLPKQTS